METYWERWNSRFCCDAKWRISINIFSHTTPLNISEIWTGTKFYIQILYSNATDSNLAVLLIFPALSISSKFQVLNLRMGDPLLQKAY